jgi:hypothetical protein
MVSIKKGTVYNDPVGTVKDNPSGYSDSAVTVTRVPYSKPQPVDGKVGSGPMYTPQRWHSPINVAAKPNIHPHVANKKSPKT